MMLLPSHLKASNPKFKLDIDFLDEQQAEQNKKETLLNLSETDSTVPENPSEDESIDPTKPKKLTRKQREDEDPQAKTLYTFVKCRTLEIANAIRYCTNGLRIDERNKLMSGISNRHTDNEAVQVDQDAAYCDEFLDNESHL